MTALAAYERLEALGRYTDPSMDHNDTEVVVSLGNVSLVLSTLSGQHLAHWSLPAVQRSVMDDGRLTLRPSIHSDDFLIIDDDIMIAALTKVDGSLRQRRKHPWRARFWVAGGVIAAAALVAGIVIPNWMLKRAAALPPQVRQQEFTLKIIQEIVPTQGPICNTASGEMSLRALSNRLFDSDPPKIFVMGNLSRPAIALPGNIIVVSGQLLAQHDDPNTVAGHVLMAHVQSLAHDPFTAMIQYAGVGAAISILTTGDIRDQDPPLMAQFTTTPPPQSLSPNLLLTAFDLAQLSAGGYANSLPTSTFRQDIEKGDPYPNGSPEPVLSDGAWLGLRDICAPA